MKTTRINKTTKLLIGLHIGFMLICAVFLCMSLSALTASKSAVGTVTFALTESPTMTMNMNYYVNNTEHTTYLGTTQATGAEIKETTDVLSVKISQESNVTIEVTFDNNIVVVPSEFSLSTKKGVGFALRSNSNGVAVFDSNSTVQAEDYIILDKLLSGIYVQKEATTQNYSIEIISQVNDTLPGRATLSGAYTNVIEKEQTTFSVNNINYGSISGLDIFEQKDNQIIIPNGTTYTSNGATMTFTDQFGVTIGTITAVPQTNTAQYTYIFSGWSSSSGTITASTSITANFTRTTNQYTVTFYNYDGTYLGASTVNYGGTATYTGATPTKPSDDTYMYVFNNSWVTTQNGSIVDNLTNVIANRSVYANFTARELLKAPIFEANGESAYNYDLTFKAMSFCTSVGNETEYLKLNVLNYCKITITLRFNATFSWNSTFSTVNGISFTMKSNSSGVAVFESDDYIVKNDYIILDKLLYPLIFSSTRSSTPYQIEIEANNSYSQSSAILSGNYTVTNRSHTGGSGG